MSFDVRLPIGLFFSVLGALLFTYGLATHATPDMSPTGVPIDLVWGALLLGFGLAMLWLARRP